MLKQFYPNEYVDSTYGIPFEQWYQKGYRGIIFDIDNTLVPHDMPADARAKRLFERLKNTGFQTCVVSNNKEPRVKSFADSVGCQYVYKAGKPLPKGYEKGMNMMNTNKKNTLFVGDQLFTDIWGAKKADLYTILVKPMNPKEEIQIVLKRYLEKVVLHFYKKHCKK